MNTRRGWGRLAFRGALIALLALAGAFLAVAWAGHEQPAQKPGYSDAQPWFDGKPWDWFLDMFNQPSIKPQEEGSFQTFPEFSVPRSGVEPFIDALAMVDGQLQRDLVPHNPTQATGESVARGRVLFEIYCGVCHGNDGNAGTPVTRKGMPAPPIRAMLPVLTEAHLYNKIRYGGPIMPPYGFQTTQAERWDMVNYMKSADFGKEATQQ